MGIKKLKVYKRPCKNCLFTENRIVSKERADSLIQGCLEDDNYFECHKSSMKKEEVGSVCCHEFYKRHKADVVSTRIAEPFGMLEWIDHDDNEKLPSYKSD